MKLVMLKGLPASGKSSYAKDHPEYKRVNNDLIREMLDHGKFSRDNEKNVSKVRETIIRNLLKNNHDVVIDDTNLNPKHEPRYRELAKEYNAHFEVVEFDTPLSVCIERDAKRDNPVGRSVITNMWQKYIKAEIVEQDKGKLKAVIFDIDGTLAHSRDRSPYDWKRVGEDKVNKPVANALANYRKLGYNIIIFTGRDGICEDLTKKWLSDNDIHYDHYGMRKAGDKRKDSIVKKELFESIKDRYYIEAVFDDRNQVVDMWREEGLTCFQVDYGDF